MAYDFSNLSDEELDARIAELESQETSPQPPAADVQSQSSPDFSSLSDGDLDAYIAGEDAIASGRQMTGHEFNAYRTAKKRAGYAAQGIDPDEGMKAERAGRERLIETRQAQENLMREQAQYVLDNTKDDNSQDGVMHRRAQKYLDTLNSVDTTRFDDATLDRSMAEVAGMHKAVADRRGHASVFADALKRGYTGTAIMSAQAYLGMTGGDDPENVATMRHLQSAGEEWDAANPKKVGGVSEIGGVGDVIDFIAESIGENAYRMAIGTTAAIASGGAAGLAGAGAMGATAAAMGGSSLSTLALNTGEAVQDQIDEGVPFSRGWALAQGIGYSVLDGAFGVEAGLGKLAVKTGLRTAKSTAIEGLKEVGKMATRKGALTTFLKGIAGEALQEPAQSQLVGRGRRWAQTGSPLRKGETPAQAWMEALDEAAGGAAAALGVGGGGTAISHANARRIVGIHNRVVEAVKKDAAFAELSPENQLLVARRLMNDSLLETDGVIDGETRSDIEKMNKAIDAELGRDDADANTRVANAILRGYNLTFAKEDFDTTVENAKAEGLKSRIDWAAMRDSATKATVDVGGVQERGTLYMDPVTNLQIFRREDENGHIKDFVVVNNSGVKDSLTGDALHTKSLEKALAACGDLDVYNQYRAKKSEGKRQVIADMFNRMYGNRGAQLVIADSLASIKDPAAREKFARYNGKAAYDASSNRVYVLADQINNVGQLYTDLAHERAHLDIAEHILGKSGGAENESERRRLGEGRERLFGGERGGAESGEERLVEAASVEDILRAVRDTNLSLPGSILEGIRRRIAGDTGFALQSISDEDARTELRFLVEHGYLGKEAQARLDAEHDTDADAIVERFTADFYGYKRNEKERRDAERAAMEEQARGKGDRKAAGEEAARVIAEDGRGESVPPITAAQEERLNRGADMEAALDEGNDTANAAAKITVSPAPLESEEDVEVPETASPSLNEQMKRRLENEKQTANGRKVQKEIDNFFYAMKNYQNVLGNEAFNAENAELLASVEEAIRRNNPQTVKEALAKLQKKVRAFAKRKNTTPTQEATDETGNVRDEASAESEEGSVGKPQAAEVAKPVEGEPPRAEAADAGVVEPSAQPAEKTATTAPKTAEAQTPAAPAKPVEAASRASGAKGANLDRPQAYLDWLKGGGMTDTDKNFSDWQKRQEKSAPKKKSARGANLRGFSYEDYGEETGDIVGAALLRHAKERGGLLRIPDKNSPDPMADWIAKFQNGNARKNRRGDYIALFGMTPRHGGNDAMTEDMPPELKTAVDGMIDNGGPEAVADWFLDVRRKYAEFADRKRDRRRQERGMPEERAATPPWETEDVPWADQIVRMGDGGTAALAVRKAEYDRWNRVLDAYERGEMKPNSHATVFEHTPAVLRRLGAPDLPVNLSKDIIDKITGIVKTQMGEEHKVPVSELRNLQIELDNPIAVFDSRSRQDAMVVLTRIVDNQNKERAVVALHLDKVRGAIHVNDIASMYGKDKQSIENWTAWGLLRYVNKQARKYSAKWFQLPSDSELRTRSVLTEKDFSGEELGRIVPQPPAESQGGSKVTSAADLQREYDEVVRRYTNADGTKKRGWMRAPNGQPTKLTERQWVQVRTPAFKEWFGDWEAVELQKWLEGDPVAKATGREYEGMSRKNIVDAVFKNWERVNHRATNPEVGEVELSRSGIHDSMAHGIGRNKLAAFDFVPEIITNGRVVRFRENWEGKGYDSHIIAAPISIGEKPCVALAVVNRSANGNRFYLHEVGIISEIKKYAEALRTGSSDEKSALSRNLGDIESIALSLFADKGASRVVDENGEPMVMWHGSTWNPAIEPNGAAVFRTGEGETGSGAHFGTLKAAEERGADRKNWNLTPVYLNIKNPLRVADTGYWTPGDIVAEVRKTEKDFPWLDNWDEITSELKRRGYDGMVYENAVEDEGSDSYIALDANQVKSATDNTGAFDGENSDIRFKRGEEEYDPRGSVPNVRGGWTEQKILRYLKAHPSLHGVMMAARLISEFDTVEELKDHMFYHGTKNFVGSMQPSMTKSERWAQEHGGGGYGQRYWGISISKSKKIASNFGNPSPGVSIYPVVLAKGAKVIDRPDLIDAADVEDHIVELWNDGVDAVRLGDWNSDTSEQELLVLNPRAICNIGNADYYRYFRLGSDENPLNIKDDAQIAQMLEAAKEYADYRPSKRFGKPLPPSMFEDGTVELKSKEVRDAERERYEKDLAEWRESERGVAAAEYERKMRDDIRFKRSAEASDTDYYFGAKESFAAHGRETYTAKDLGISTTDKAVLAAAHRYARDFRRVKQLMDDAILGRERTYTPVDVAALTVKHRDLQHDLADVLRRMESTGNPDEFQAEKELIEAQLDNVARASSIIGTKTGQTLRAFRIGISDDIRDSEAYILQSMRVNKQRKGLGSELTDAEVAKAKQMAEQLKAENEKLKAQIAELEANREKNLKTQVEATDRPKRTAARKAAKTPSTEQRKKDFAKKYGHSVSDSGARAWNLLAQLSGKTTAMFKGGKGEALTPDMMDAFAQIVEDMGGDYEAAASAIKDNLPDMAGAFAQFRSSMEKRDKSDISTLADNFRKVVVPKHGLAELAQPITDQRLVTTKDLAGAREECSRQLDENEGNPREQRIALGHYLRRYRDALINENPDIPMDELNEKMAAEATALTGTEHDATAMLAVAAGVDGYDLETRAEIQRKIAKAQRALDLFRAGKINEAARESGLLYEDEATALAEMEATLQKLMQEKADEIDYLGTFSEKNKEAVERVKQLKEEIKEMNGVLHLMRKEAGIAEKKAKYAEVLEKRLAEAQRSADSLQGEIDSDEFKERKAKAEAKVAELKAALAVAKRDEYALKKIKDRIAELEKRIADGDYDRQLLQVRANDAELQAKIRMQRERRNALRRRLDDERRRMSYREKGIVGKTLYGMGAILGEMKSVVASFDLSSVLRQGGQLTWAHPFIAARNLQETLKSWKSEEYADKLMTQLRQRPNWRYYEKAGIDFTDWGENAANKEDVYLLNQYRKITNSRLLKKGVMASERAFSMFLDLMRADVFDAMAAGSTFGSAANMNDSQLKAMGRFINIASQRGAFEKGGKVANAIPFLNMFLWSPRNVASRFQFLGESARLLTGGAAYGDKTMRRLFAKELVRYIGGMSAAAMFLKAMAELFRDDDDPPNDMEFDPRSSDFLKVRFGNIRIDMTSGLTPIMVFASRMLSGETKNLRGQVRESNRYELVGRFLRQKFAPGASLVYDMGIAREDFERRDIDWTSLWEKDAEHISAYRYFVGSFVPLTGADLLEQAQVGGIPKTFATGFLTALGANVQAFDPYNYKQLKGDYTYFRGLYDKATDPEERRHLLEYHPMLKRRLRIEAELKNVRYLDRILKNAEKNGQSRPDLEERVKAAKQRAVDAMAGF